VAVADVDHTDAAETGLNRRLARNLTAQSASQAIGILVSIGTVAVLTRALPPEAFGAYNLLFAIIYFFLSFNDLGIMTTLLREITHAPSHATELVQAVIGLRLTMAVLSMAAGWLVLQWSDLPAGYQLAQLVFLLILPVQAFATGYVVLQARLQIGRLVVSEIANRVAGFVLMLVAVALGQGLLWITIALVAGEVAGAATVIAMTHRAVTPRPRIVPAVWRDIVRKSLPIGANTLVIATINRVDMLLLQRLSPTTEIGLVRVGQYGTAYRIPNLAERVPQLMMGTVLPMMMSLAQRDLAALRRLYRRVLMYLGLLAIPMVVAVQVSAPWIVRWWAGPDYDAAVPLIRALIWASALLYLAIPAGNVMVALGYQRVNLGIMVPATILNIALNLLWIPRYGAAGAAWATVAAYGWAAAGHLVAAEVIFRKVSERPTS
jgi:O-antigen/teichoic acid export membrane protein